MKGEDSDSEQCMKTPASERDLRAVIKTIVQTGRHDRADLTFTPSQQVRIDDAFEMYKRRDKSKPLHVEVTLGVRKKPKRGRGAQPPEFSECPRCEMEIRLVHTPEGVKRLESNCDEPHVCYHERFTGGAFESNRRKH